ncbi:MAG: hypothetical protein IPO19_11940 [Rhodoferax sp.]|nr:hypothetical protein [Rhodoferax sp.]
MGGYVIEGHVPVRGIQRLLRELAISVGSGCSPGMPVGPPGMDMVFMAVARPLRCAPGSKPMAVRFTSLTLKGGITS